MAVRIWISSFWICSLLPGLVKASNITSDRNCSIGPFSFENEDVWNTTGTSWTVESTPRLFRSSNHYMELDFDDYEHLPSVRHSIMSPTLCARWNGTYEISFRFSVPGLPLGFLGGTSCLLSLYVIREEGGKPRRVWRSTGGTFFDRFQTVSPPVRIRVCAGRFWLMFEAAKEDRGPCSRIVPTNEVTFDDVSFIQLQEKEGKEDTLETQPLCTDDLDTDANDVKGGLTTGVVIAIIVSAAVVIIVIAALVMGAAFICRKREKPEAPIMRRAAGYKTFGEYIPERQSSADYESMDVGDKPLVPSNPSGGNDDYNRLRMTEGATPGDYPHVHYDHVMGNTKYSDLGQQERARDLQRLTRAQDYDHV